MKIKFYGHSAFMIKTDSGTRIITDPYQSGSFGGALCYDKITDETDIVLSSHSHNDHNYTEDIKGDFIKIDKPGSYVFSDLKIRAIPTFHDLSKGSERGGNLVFVLDADGLTIVHAEDLGHMLEKETVQEIGKADILLIPVGGFYTIDAAQATRVMTNLEPAITIPMHYKTDKCNFPIAGVEEFVRNKKNVKITKTREIEININSLPEKPEILVLEHAL